MQVKPDLPRASAAHSPAHRRSWTTALLVVLALAAVGILVFPRFKAPDKSTPSASATRPEAGHIEPDAPPATTPAGSDLAQVRSQPDAPPRSVPVETPGTPQASTALPRESVYSQQLIQEMAMQQFPEGNLLPEQASRLREHFKALASEGTAAVPAIRQFLDQNQDIDLRDSRGAAPAGYASLRTGLLDILNRIGGPQAVDALANTLRGTGEPAEIWAIAHYLEQQAPGAYRQEVLGAARETLNRTAQGQLHVQDAGPLFQVLQALGDGTVAADLAGAMPKWNYYATIALAGLQDGQGVPALAEHVRQSAGQNTTPDLFAVQMLAQMAAQSPDAASTLMDWTRQGQVSERAWAKIAEGLTGDQYEIGRAPATRNAPGVKTYHIASGNQNFHTIPFDPNLNAELTDQRRGIIDQLLAFTQDPVAIQELQKARAALAPAGP